jgi:hypothetical protein
LNKELVESLEKKLANLVLPRDHNTDAFGRKEQWASNLQARRAASLVSFFNFRRAGKTRMQASQLAAVALGRAAAWGGRNIRKWAEEYKQHRFLPESRRGEFISLALTNTKRTLTQPQT